MRYTCIEKENIKTTQVLNGFGDQALAILRFTNVRFHGNGIRAQLTALIRDPL